jgi:hypothetical protein
MINVTIDDKKKGNVKPFPKLMRSENGQIVFFLKPGEGTLLYRVKNGLVDVGEFVNNWATGNFTDYNEPITIQNA